MDQHPPQHPYNLEQWKQYKMQQQAIQQGYAKKKGCGCGKKKKIDTNKENDQEQK
ncbi:cytochrome C oxidase subunit III [Microbacteriaceae bacterium 4G12]